MQAEWEDLSGLKRKLKVKVPLETVLPVYEKAFSSIKRQVRLKGFRQGKLPAKIVEKRFQSEMHNTVVQELLPKYFEQALGEKGIKAATMPRFSEMVVDREKAFEFEAEFEQMPVFQLPNPEQWGIEPEEALVEKEEEETRLEELRRREGQLVKKEEAAEKGDVVKVKIRKEGEEDQGWAKAQEVELGNKTLPPALEEALFGMREGEEKSLTLEDQEPKETLNLQVEEVQSVVLAEIDEAFLKKQGDVSSEEVLREKLRESIKTEKEERIKEKQKIQLADKIREKTDFPVAEEPVQNLLLEEEKRLEKEDKKMDEKEKKLYSGKIQADLRLQHVINAWGEKHKLQVDEEKLKQRYLLQCYLLREDPQKFLQSQRGENLLHSIRRELLADAVLNHMLQQALSGSKKEETSAPEPS